MLCSQHGNQTECKELEAILLSFTRQIASGVGYLSVKEYIHRDLAARNVLVSNEGVCKVCSAHSFFFWMQPQTLEICLFRLLISDYLEIFNMEITTSLKEVKSQSSGQLQRPFSIENTQLLVTFGATAVYSMRYGHLGANRIMMSLMPRFKHDVMNAKI